MQGDASTGEPKFEEAKVSLYSIICLYTVFIYLYRITTDQYRDKVLLVQTKTKIKLRMRRSIMT